MYCRHMQCIVHCDEHDHHHLMIPPFFFFTDPLQDGELTFLVARLEPWSQQLQPPDEVALNAAVETWDAPGGMDGWDSVKTAESGYPGLGKSIPLKRNSSMARCLWVYA